jgi:hypothetical protein
MAEAPELRHIYTLLTLSVKRERSSVKPAEGDIQTAKWTLPHVPTQNQPILTLTPRARPRAPEREPPESLARQAIWGIGSENAPM